MSVPARPPSLHDVAALAGVSHQTVSRVVNASSHVSASTRARVEDAIGRLGYRPNLSARALATSSTRLIGIVAGGFPHMGPAATVGAIELAARARGLTTLVAVLDEGSAAEVSEVHGAFLAHGVQGIIAVTPRQQLADLLASHGRTPTVLITEARPGLTDHHLVAVDSHLGALRATQALIEGGARDIRHVSGPPDWFDAINREAGWRDALTAAGLPIPEPLVGDWSADTGYAIGRRMAAGPLPDGVFCANDLTALGLLAAFREAGVRVPADVSVVGFDDIDAARYLQPALTTVRQPFSELGHAALDRLVAVIEGRTLGPLALEPTLMVRASTR